MANDQLWQQLLKLDGHETTARAKCEYFPGTNCYSIVLLSKTYTVDLSKRQILLSDTGAPAGFGQELCILVYLINSKDVPLADKLAPPESLPDGQFFFRGPHKLPTEKLQAVFGQKPQLLYELIDEFAAARCQFGDAAIQLDVLPRLPVTIVIWRADEEFAARASILFDRTAARQMPLDALQMAVNLTVQAIVDAAQKAS
jgi:hypothetical protein